MEPFGFLFKHKKKTRNKKNSTLHTSKLEKKVLKCEIVILLGVMHLITS